MRQWREQSRKSPAAGRSASSGRGRRDDGGWDEPDDGARGSRANWRAGGSSRGQQRARFDDGGYDDAPPLRSSNRNRRQADEYDEVDLERALVPTRDDLTPMLDPQAMNAAALALPGFPATDDEERALGIRRPVYIPANGEKRKRKLGTWRVISGVLSVLLVCVASCGVGGLLAQKQLAAFFKGPTANKTTVVPFSTAGVPATPVATINTDGSGKYFSNVTTAKRVDSSFIPQDETSHFQVGDYVYVDAYVKGLPDPYPHIVTVRWFLNDQDLGLHGGYLTQQLTNDPHGCPPADGCHVYFSLSFTQVGKGSAKIYLDKPATDAGDKPNDPTLAATIYFAVQEPTPTPTKGGTPSATTTATAGK